MKLIERTEYLDVLKRVCGTPDIKVVTGIRRSGKSKLLDSFATWIEKNDKKANVIKINFNLSKFKNQMSSGALEEFAEKSYKPKKNNYLFIDEVQLCESFEKALNSLHASEKYDIYVTGSNAFLLSSDLATLFTGRTFEIPIFPFSFIEYTKYYKPKNIDASFDAYVKEGGMAEIRTELMNLVFPLCRRANVLRAAIMTNWAIRLHSGVGMWLKRNPRRLLMRLAGTLKISRNTAYRVGLTRMWVDLSAA